MVVGDNAALEKYKRELEKDPKVRGTYQIYKLFEEHNFKLTKTTWVMEHTEKYEPMKKVIERAQIKLKSGKPMHLISVSKYLELTYGLLEHEY